MEQCYEMTWREYHLKRAGWFRQEEREWEKVRWLSYNNHTASGSINPKKTSLQKFMPLNSDPKPKKASNSAKEALLKAQEIYLKQKNGS